MLSEGIVFLDSDDDKEVKPVMETAEISRDQESEQANSDMTSADMENNSREEPEEVVVEYNHNDYADLVGPMNPPAPAPRLLAAPVPPNKTVPLSSQAANRIPKKPGSLPPFALFSQEMRAKLQEEDPDMSFGDLGRKLGEMWHALKVRRGFLINFHWIAFIFFILTVPAIDIGFELLILFIYKD